MFKINVNFKCQRPPKRTYSRMNIDEIYEYITWEAELSVIFNDQTLFAEEIAIIEFYWYLTNWNRKYILGEKISFMYTSVEHTVPILVFSYHPKGCWKIDSIWKQCDEPAIITDSIFRSEICNLLDKLMFTLEGNTNTVDGSVC